MYFWKTGTDLAIDLGTATVLVYVKGKGGILKEPSVVAINKNNNKLLAIGEEARKMIGRTPGNIVAVRPLRDGVISDYDITQKMLKEFIKKACGKRSIRAPKVIVCVPSQATEVEKRAVIDAAMNSGAKKVYLIEEPLAAAIGAGLDITKPNGCMVVDIGGGTCDIAVISLGGIVKTSSVRIAGDKLDEAIVQYVRQKHNLLIGEKTAEDVKINIASATELDEELEFEIRGRNILNGLPRNVVITSSELREATEELLNQMIEEIKVTLEKTPPELSADIYQKGIVLAGGGANIRNLDKKISESIKIPVVVAEDPLCCVVKGIEILLKDFDKYKEVIISPSDY